MASHRTLEQSTAYHYIFLVVLIVACALASILVWPATAARTHPSSVEVIDDAHAVDQSALRDQLSDTKFFTAPRVVVRTYLSDSPQPNVNKNTLDWAREHKDAKLLAKGGKAPADNTVIVTLNFEVHGHGQKLTTKSYGVDVMYGKGLSVDDKLRSHAGDSAAKSVERGKYTAAAAAAVKYNADVMGQPTIRKAALSVIIIGGSIGLIVFILAFVYPWPRRRRMAKARANFDTVAPVLEQCRAARNKLPDDGSWGTKARAVAADFGGRYDDATALLARIDARGFVRVNAANLGLAADIDEFEKAANEFLAPAAQMLVRLTTLYGREDGWERVWDEEVADTRAGLDTSFGEVAIDTMVPANDLDDLRDIAEWGNEFLDGITTDGHRLLPTATALDAPAADLAGAREVGADVASIVDELLDRIISIRAKLSTQMYVVLEHSDFHERDDNSEPADTSRVHNSSYRPTYLKFMEKARREDNFAAQSVVSFFDAEKFYAPASYARGFIAGRREVRWSKVGDAANRIRSAERRAQS